MNLKVQILISTASLAIALGFFVFPFEAPAKEAVQEDRSVSTRLVPSGYKEVIQRVESKMQPTAVQVHETVDPATGASKQTVAPIIMERRERLLQTTILEPQTLETTKTKTRVTTSSTVHSNHVQSSQPRSIAYRNAPSTRTRVSERTKVRTTDITREPVMKKTVITPPLAPFPIESPQIIQKIEEVRASQP